MREAPRAAALPVLLASFVWLRLCRAARAGARRADAPRCADEADTGFRWAIIDEDAGTDRGAALPAPRVPASCAQRRTSFAS
eukprot:gene18666-23000_t